MDPSFWGKSTWLYLHTLTFNYPESPTQDDKTKMYNYFKQLSQFLPCPSCSKAYEIYFNYIPITEYLDDVYGLTFWLYTIHFIVNTKLHKETPNFISVVKTYLSHKTQCNIKCSSNKSKTPPNVYLNFKNIAEQKYMQKTKEYTSKLLTDYPSL
jgi:hypothetical protein